MNHRYRLIKPLWAQPCLPNGKPNPKFKEEIVGPKIVEDYFTEEEIQEYNDKGYNIYYFPNGASNVEGVFLSGKEIDLYKVVFVDMDLKDEVYESKDAFLEKLAEFPVAPSRIVDSGNGVHVYWNIDELTREDYIAAQFSLINHFETDGSVWTPLQLMRVGGYNNTKRHKDYVMAELLHDEEDSYSLEDLFAHLEPPSESQMKKLDKHCAKLDGTFEMPEFNEIDFETLPVRFIHLMESNERMKNLYHNPKEAAGDRSKADYSLANMLFDADFDFSECVQVIAQGLKAKERSDGNEYAYSTVDKVYEIRTEEETSKTSNSTIETMEEYLQDLSEEDMEIGTKVNGSPYWDILHEKWQTSQVLGIIAGSGVGKTEATLNEFRYMAEKDPESLYVFFSLEMPKRQIAKRWLNIIQGDSKLSKSLVVIGNEDDEGMPRNIGIQDIYSDVRRIEKRYGKKVKVVAIDHILILARTMDPKKKPVIEAEFEQRANRDGSLTFSQKGLMYACKALAKSLDVFLIVQSQTTKEKAGDGDVPLDISAAYGSAAFEWYCDHIITMWRPLALVQDEADVCVTGWQYAKIREQHEEDGVKRGVKKLLHFDQVRKCFRNATKIEHNKALELLTKVNAKRALKEKNTLNDYQYSSILKAVKGFKDKTGD